MQQLPCLPHVQVSWKTNTQTCEQTFTLRPAPSSVRKSTPMFTRRPPLISTRRPPLTSTRTSTPMSTRRPPLTSTRTSTPMFTRRPSPTSTRTFAPTSTLTSTQRSASMSTHRAAPTSAPTSAQEVLPTSAWRFTLTNALKSIQMFARASMPMFTRRLGLTFVRICAPLSVTKHLIVLWNRFSDQMSSESVNRQRTGCAPDASSSNPKRTTSESESIDRYAHTITHCFRCLCIQHTFYRTSTKDTYKQIPKLTPGSCSRLLQKRCAACFGGTLFGRTFKE